jgi:ATP-binding cassette subfamily B protein RaxB
MFVDFTAKIFNTHRLPIILHSESSECGLASLAMVASYHGYQTSLAELRSRFSVSLKGMTLKDIIGAANKLGLSGRPLRCEPAELAQLKSPAILHWNMNHFVVLAEAGNRKAVIHDPARGRRTIGRDEISRSFTGVALELVPTPEFQRKESKPRATLRDFWSRIQGLGFTLLQLFLLSLLLQFFSLLAPLVNQFVVDEAIARQDIDLLGTLILGFAILALIQSGVRLLRSYVAMYLENHMTFQMRTNLLYQLLRLPHSFFEKRHVGDIVTRFGSLMPVQQLLTSGLMRAILDSLMAVGAFIIMLVYSPFLAAIVTAGLLIQFIAQLVSFPYVRRVTELGIQASADTETHFLESIRASRSIRLFGREDLRLSTWQNLFADQLNAGVRLTRFNAWATACQGLVSSGEKLLVLYFAARSIISGQMTVGMLFAFMSYRGSFVLAATGLLSTFFQWRMVGLHLERLSDIVQNEPEQVSSIVEKPIRTFSGRVKVKELDFRYGDQEPRVLRRVSFEVEAGERVVIVGPSGSGKSTLIKLLAGLYRPDGGSILYDGRPLGYWGVSCVRSNLGVVMQDDRLLSGSLADNIAFFDPQPDRERVEACARSANIHEEIMKMPMGYSTLVGDMGSALSSGQIQRTLLARALYPDPSILLLDEGTANLDSGNEEKIIGTLSNISATQIIVAHRSRIISSADRVLSFESLTE